MRHLTVVLVTATLSLVTACKRHDGQTASTTTVRSGTPEGVRVTGTPPPTEKPPSSDDSEDADRLTAAICTHERNCAKLRAQHGAAETPEFDEDACVTEIKSVVVLALETLDCSPAIARAGIEECLAAIRAERCDANEAPSIVPQCRPSAMCRRGEIGRELEP